MPHTPEEIATQLYAAMPHELPIETLAEYGFDATPHQAQHITREMLSLNLYLVECALKANLPAAKAGRVFQAVQQCVRVSWTSELKLVEHDVGSYWNELRDRGAAYERVEQEGGPPVSLFMETAGLLESARITPREDRQKLLALFIDLVPVDAYGEITAGIELAT